MPDPPDPTEEENRYLLGWDLPGGDGNGWPVSRGPAGRTRKAAKKRAPAKRTAKRRAPAKKVAKRTAKRRAPAKKVAKRTVKRRAPVKKAAKKRAPAKRTTTDRVTLSVLAVRRSLR